MGREMLKCCRRKEYIDIAPLHVCFVNGKSEV